LVVTKRNIMKQFTNCNINIEYLNLFRWHLMFPYLLVIVVRGNVKF